MSVPTFEEIKQALKIPEFKRDKWGRRIYERSDNLPREVNVSRNTIQYKNQKKGKWDG
tara:strand:+ start:435 stop:608 length:174 start_codon:yes stop_codon:yes gene_type:complete